MTAALAGEGGRRSQGRRNWEGGGAFFRIAPGEGHCWCHSPEKTEGEGIVMTRSLEHIRPPKEKECSLVMKVRSTRSP